MNGKDIDLIERKLIAKKIQEYEIFWTTTDIHETEFLKNQVDIEREVKDSEYVLRILSQQDMGTGIGIIKGNSMNPKDIEKNIDSCLLLAKNNVGPKYFFPRKKANPNIKTFDDRIIKDPVGIMKDSCEVLIKEINDQKGVSPTFGRFRIHVQREFLRNSNQLDLDSLKTYFFIEFALKAQKNGSMAESWEVEYVKEKEQLNLRERVKKWARIAKDTLNAKMPKSSTDAIVVFPPHVLKNAINPVIGFHASGRAFHEKVSLLNLDEIIASEEFSLNDNGLLESGLRTSSWDGEGNPHQNNLIINKGNFIKRIYDQKFAIMGNTDSTGNGVRIADGSVINGITNFQIEPGVISIDDLISEIKEGYYIEKCSWLNPDRFSGSFGTEIRNGYYIENGKFKYPIKGGNLSGNVLEMIKNCHLISKEREFSANTLFPYMSFTSLKISS
ncbi:MAG: TldD/PmbA family protein [Promethearchaeota archaeon]|nr:MAG: TldD/PmbA family protein [Candidatus Lokiarchaeota archaeon]